MNSDSRGARKDNVLRMHFFLSGAPHVQAVFHTLYSTPLPHTHTHTHTKQTKIPGCPRLDADARLVRVSSHGLPSSPGVGGTHNQPPSRYRSQPPRSPLPRPGWSASVAGRTASPSAGSRSRGQVILDSVLPMTTPFNPPHTHTPHANTTPLTQLHTIAH